MVTIKNTCINIVLNEYQTCFRYYVQCSVFKIYEKDNPHIIIHYSNLRDNIIIWECVKYPCSRKCIDRFEELNSDLIYVNLFKQFNKEETTLSQIELQK